MSQKKLFFESGVDSRVIRDINYFQSKNSDVSGVQRSIISKMIHAHPEGITDFEICAFTGFSRTSVTARRNEIYGVKPIGFAKIITEDGDRLNTLWGVSKANEEI